MGWRQKTVVTKSAGIAFSHLKTPHPHITVFQTVISGPRSFIGRDIALNLTPEDARTLVHQLLIKLNDLEATDTNNP